MQTATPTSHQDDARAAETFDALRTACGTPLAPEQRGRLLARAEEALRVLELLVGGRARIDDAIDRAAEIVAAVRGVHLETAWTQGQSGPALSA